MTETEERFAKLASQWKKETAHLSSISGITNHPAYQEILAMGDAVIPLIFADLQHRPGLWFHALARLTGANPISDEDRGYIESVRQAWIRWGREHGYITTPDGRRSCKPEQD